jgi:nucleoside 2-deoxyribosyltransferase
MPTKSFDRTLAFLAGRLADAIRPGDKEQPAAPAKTGPVIYLADNSRLQPDAHKQRDQVEALCRRYGMRVAWPSEHAFFPSNIPLGLRVEVGPPIDDLAPGRVLHKAWRLIGGCHALIAEITPFRGPHMNPVVAFEIGVAVVHEIPVFAWTTALWPSLPGRGPRFKLLDDRIWCGHTVAPDGNWRAEDDGLVVENFEMVEPAAIAGNFASLSDSREAAIRAAAQFFDSGSAH